jgi:hypothetical protein
MGGACVCVRVRACVGGRGRAGGGGRAGGINQPGTNSTALSFRTFSTSTSPIFTADGGAAIVFNQVLGPGWAGLGWAGLGLATDPNESDVGGNHSASFWSSRGLM